MIHSLSQFLAFLLLVATPLLLEARLLLVAIPGPPSSVLVADKYMRQTLATQMLEYLFGAVVLWKATLVRMVQDFVHG